jgi:CRISPR-associated exonuclease Cas4
MIPEAEAIAISALQHWSYCPRQCALIHLDQVFADNVYTDRGNAVHALVDEPGAEQKGTVRIERAMPLWNERLGLIGKADLVEFAASGRPYPVEYKHGPRRHKDHDDVQVAAQAMCLEEMTGIEVPKGAIFHFSSRRRREITIGPALREAVAETTAAIRAMLTTRRLPAPVFDARCRNCSLIELCQPEAVSSRDLYARLLAELRT